jgi:hypothetical protein
MRAAGTGLHNATTLLELDHLSWNHFICCPHAVSISTLPLTSELRAVQDTDTVRGERGNEMWQVKVKLSLCLTN